MNIKVIKCATGTITDVNIKITYANKTIASIWCVYVYIYIYLQVLVYLSYYIISRSFKETFPIQMEHVKSCQKNNFKKRRIFDCLFKISSLCLYAGGQLNPTSAGFLLALAKQGDSV